MTSSFCVYSVARDSLLPSIETLPARGWWAWFCGQMTERGSQPGERETQRERKRSCLPQTKKDKSTELRCGSIQWPPKCSLEHSHLLFISVSLPFVTFASLFGQRFHYACAAMTTSSFISLNSTIMCKESVHVLTFPQISQNVCRWPNRSHTPTSVSGFRDIDGAKWTGFGHGPWRELQSGDSPVKYTGSPWGAHPMKKSNLCLKTWVLGRHRCQRRSANDVQSEIWKDPLLAFLSCPDSICCFPALQSIWKMAWEHAVSSKHLRGFCLPKARKHLLGDSWHVH